MTMPLATRREAWAGQQHRPSPAQSTYIDTPPWAGGTPIAMNASDGTFNATSENVAASVNTTGLADGKHTAVCARSRCRWQLGAGVAVFFNITSTPLPQNYTLAPAAVHAQVRGGNNANTNYGSLSAMDVRLSTNSNDTRYTYIKFDTSSVPAGAVTSAKIRLYGSNSGGGSIGVIGSNVANSTLSQALSRSTTRQRPAHQRLPM